MGPAAPRHVGSSQTRARTHVPCIGRQILNHCTTREAPTSFFFIMEFSALNIAVFCYLSKILFFLNAKFMHYQNKPHFQGLLWTHQEQGIPHSQSNRDSASKKGASKMFSPTQDGRIGQSLNLGVLQS